MKRSVKLLTAVMVALCCAAAMLPLSGCFSVGMVDRLVSCAAEEGEGFAMASEMSFGRYKDGWEVTGYTGERSELYIPDSYQGRPVLRIGDAAFTDNLTLEKVYIPASVVEIGKGAFMNCWELERLTISGSAHIGESAFEGCWGLYEVNMEASVSIGPRAFASCSELKRIVLPETLTVIEDEAFERCWDLAEVSFPDSLTRIGVRAFASCDLKTVELGSGPVEIDDFAFQNSFEISKVDLGGAVRLGEETFDALYIDKLVIPDTLKAMGNGNFSHSRVHSLHIGSGLEEFEDILFEGFMELKEITLSPDNKALRLSDGVLYTSDRSRLLLYPAADKRDSYVVPDKVREIGHSAFYGAENLVSITLPDSIRVIDDYAFFACHGLEELSIPEGVTELGLESVACCGSLVRVQLPESLRKIDRYAFHLCSSLTEVDLPDGLEVLEDECFAGCPITSVDLGTKLRRMGANPFAGAPVITISVAPENRYFHVVDGCLYTLNGREMVLYPRYSPAESFTVPDGVEIIRAGAFRFSDNLREVILPEGLKTIGEYAFYSCERLESINLPDGLETIGYWAFEGCPELKDLHIPESVSLTDTEIYIGFTTEED